jgi:serine protease Do
VLRISAAARLPVAKLGESSALRVGEWVIALGSPLHLSNRCGASMRTAASRALCLGSVFPAYTPDRWVPRQRRE